MEFSVDENKFSSDQVKLEGEKYPAWLQIKLFRCKICPLPVQSKGPCPAALSIKPVVETFADRISYEEVKTIVEINQVKMESDIAMQNTVRSLVGLLMALSACPIMEKLRPLALYHLPFSDRNQTIFRVLGMYLTSQYVRQASGLEPDWKMEGLNKLYQQISLLNGKMAERIRAAVKMDATINSLIVLDAFAMGVTMGFEESFEEIKDLFYMYLKNT